MPALTSEGETLVHDLAARHGFGEEAVAGLLAAMVAGHGRAAQFAHPELGGSGQWMAGGMLMIGDMFDNALKARVGALCDDLARAVASADIAPARSQRQTQGGGDDSSGHLAATPFFEPSASGGSDAWWPRELGTPSASGAQGAMRYAHFADARRLALDDGREVRVHDTLDHRIGGFSQRQGGGDGLTLSSQHGTVDLATLPVVSRDGRPEPGARAGATPEPPTPEPPTPASAVDAVADASTVATRVDDAGAERGPAAAATPTPTGDDPLGLIERLGRLRDQGLVSEEEFADKKRELLSRL